MHGTEKEYFVLLHEVGSFLGCLCFLCMGYFGTKETPSQYKKKQI
jgi:hypothetical protein